MYTFKMPAPGKVVYYQALHRAKMRHMALEGYVMNVVSGIGLIAGAADIWTALYRVCR